MKKQSEGKLEQIITDIRNGKHPEAARRREVLLRAKNKRISLAEFHKDAQIKNIEQLYSYEIEEAQAIFERDYSEVVEQLVIDVSRELKAKNSSSNQSQSNSNKDEPKYASRSLRSLGTSQLVAIDMNSSNRTNNKKRSEREKDKEKEKSFIEKTILEEEMRSDFLEIVENLKSRAKRMIQGGSSSLVSDVQILLHPPSSSSSSSSSCSSTSSSSPSLSSSNDSSSPFFYPSLLYRGEIFHLGSPVDVHLPDTSLPILPSSSPSHIPSPSPHHHQQQKQLILTTQEGKGEESGGGGGGGIGGVGKRTVGRTEREGGKWEGGKWERGKWEGGKWEGGCVLRGVITYLSEDILVIRQGTRTKTTTTTTTTTEGEKEKEKERESERDKEEEEGEGERDRKNQNDNVLDDEKKLFKKEIKIENNVFEERKTKKFKEEDENGRKQKQQQQGEMMMKKEEVNQEEEEEGKGKEIQTITKKETRTNMKVITRPTGGGEGIRFSIPIHHLRIGRASISKPVHSHLQDAYSNYYLDPSLL